MHIVWKLPENLTIILTYFPNGRQGVQRNAYGGDFGETVPERPGGIVRRCLEPVVEVHLG